MKINIPEQWMATNVELEMGEIGAGNPNFFNKDKFFPENLDCQDIAEMLYNEAEIDLVEILRSLKERLKKQNIEFKFSFKAAKSK